MPCVVVFCLAGSILLPARGVDGDQSTGGISDEEFQLPLDHKAAEEVDELIEQLGSPVYREREAASTRLTEIGASAFAKLRLAYRQTDDIEVRLRIETLVHQAYFDFRVYDRNGFLGVMQRPAPIDRKIDPRIAEGQLGIEITRVLAETAAAKAKIKKGDIIVELNDEPLGVNKQQPVVSFGDRLLELGPGTRIKLRILRGSETKEIYATLGRRTREYYGRASTARDMLIKARGDFESWWVYHFREQHTSGDGD